MFDSDGSADYVNRAYSQTMQYEFEHGVRQVRGSSFVHGVVFGIALVLFRRAIRNERRG